MPGVTFDLPTRPAVRGTCRRLLESWQVRRARMHRTAQRQLNVHRCRACGHALDPSTNPRDNVAYRNRYCRRCYNRLFFRCVRCGRRYPTYNQSELANVCTRCDGSREYSGHNEATWEAGADSYCVSFDRCTSERRFGVEIETAECRNASAIDGKTRFGAKHDGSISGREFYSPILKGDMGFAEIDNFCDHAKRRGWSVDYHCGTHIHLDMPEGTDALKAVTVGYLLTYDYWAQLVPEHRRTNCYCPRPRYDVRDVVQAYNFRSFARCQDRYQFFNIAAYVAHTTFEVRGLEGTLDKQLIKNWLKVHLTFTDFCATLSVSDVCNLFPREQDNWATFRRLALKDTARYFCRRRASFKS